MKRVNIIIIGIADRKVLCDNKIWKDQTGSHHFIPEMDRDHAANAYRWLAIESSMDMVERKYMQMFHERIMQA